MKTRKRILVVYYSMTGNTARVARDLVARLDADVEIIADQRHGAGFIGHMLAAYDAVRKVATPIGPPKYNPADYELTIVGTPVWVGQMTPPVRAYLEQMRGQLPSVAFFNTSGGTSMEKILPSLQLAADCNAIAATGFDAHELKQTNVYEHKLSAFVQTIKLAPARAA